MESKKLITEKISESEKELLELFRTLKSAKYQNRFIGMADHLIEDLKQREINEKPNLKIIK